jgi:hypothetical protein
MSFAGHFFCAPGVVANLARCRSHSSGNGCSKSDKANPTGCCPLMIASMMFGANKVSLRIDPTYPRSIFSANAISLIEA